MFRCVTIDAEVKETTNPNPLPIGIRFGFVAYGGRYKTRTAKFKYIITFSV